MRFPSYIRKSTSGKPVFVLVEAGIDHAVYSGKDTIGCDFAYYLHVDGTGEYHTREMVTSITWDEDKVYHFSAAYRVYYEDEE